MCVLADELVAITYVLRCAVCLVCCFRAAVLDGVTDFLLFLCKLFVVGGIGICRLIYYLFFMSLMLSIF